MAKRCIANISVVDLQLIAVRIFFIRLSHASECGKKNLFRPESRIIGGREAYENEFPWMAGIISVNRSQVICGASIINDRYVITAAHCIPYGYVYALYTCLYTYKSLSIRLVDFFIRSTFLSSLRSKRLTISCFYSFDKDDMKVSIGTHSSCKWDARTTIFSVEEIFPHPNYDRQTNFADIMLVKLVMRITFDQFVSPICLPKTGNHHNFTVQMYFLWHVRQTKLLIITFNYSHCNVGLDTVSRLGGQSVSALGWGLSEDNSLYSTNCGLRLVDLTLFKKQECPTSVPSLICAGHMTIPRGTCGVNKHTQHFLVCTKRSRNCPQLLSGRPTIRTRD